MEGSSATEHLPCHCRICPHSDGPVCVALALRALRTDCPAQRMPPAWEEEKAQRQECVAGSALTG